MKNQITITMFKILPTNRFSKAKSYNFHFHKSEHRDLLLQMAYVFRANPCENSRMERATFSKFYLLPGRLQWNAWQTCVPLLTSEPEYLGKWKAPPFSRPVSHFFQWKLVPSPYLQTNGQRNYVMTAMRRPLPVSQRFGHPRVLGIPISKSLAFWASPVGDA